MVIRHMEARADHARLAPHDTTPLPAKPNRPRASDDAPAAKTQTCHTLCDEPARSNTPGHQRSGMRYTKHTKPEGRRGGGGAGLGMEGRGQRVREGVWLARVVAQAECAQMAPQAATQHTRGSNGPRRAHTHPRPDRPRKRPHGILSYPPPPSRITCNAPTPTPRTRSVEEQHCAHRPRVTLHTLRVARGQHRPVHRWHDAEADGRREHRVAQRDPLWLLRAG